MARNIDKILYEHVQYYNEQEIRWWPGVVRQLRELRQTACLLRQSRN